MGQNDAAFPFSPAGRRWPEGSDEGVAQRDQYNFFRLRPPPHPPAGTFSPKGRRGSRYRPPAPYSIALLT